MIGMVFDHDTCEIVPLMVSVRVKAPEPPRVRDYILVGEVPLPPTSSRIIKAVADYYGIDSLALSSEIRSQWAARPRQLAMYLCRTVAHHSFPRIGKDFGGRDHTTALHACRAVEARLKVCPDTLEAYRVLREGLA